MNQLENILEHFLMFTVGMYNSFFWGQATRYLFGICELKFGNKLFRGVKKWGKWAVFLMEATRFVLKTTTH